MKVSRRQLAALASGSVIASVALAQTPAAPPDPDQAVRDNNKRISDALAKYEIPLATEPAFQFKAD